MRISSIYVDAKVVIFLPTTKARPASKRPSDAKNKAPKRKPAAAARRPSAARVTAHGRKKPARKAGLKRLRGLPILGKGRTAASKQAPRKNKKRMSAANRRVLSLIWLLPVGIPMMWQRSCTWKRGVKIGVTAAAAALVLALLIFPFPTSNRDLTGGVQLVNNVSDVEVYGPDLPTYIVPGYVDESAESIIVDAVENTVHYVYAADGAKCYHEYECKFAFASSQRLTVYEAYYLGFEPCKRCNPPKYDGKI